MARRRFVIQPLEDRLVPSFTISPSMSPDELAQFTESRADMYAVEASRPAARSDVTVALELRDFTPLRIDHATLSAHLAGARGEFEAGETRVLAVPRPDGTFDRFNVWEVQMMEPELAAKFPDIRTWRGQGIDDPTATLTADLTMHGFHAQVIGSTGRWYVDPYYHLDTTLYAAYAPQDLVDGHKDGFTEILQHLDPHDHTDEPAPVAERANYGQTLRTYRTAVAATGEYTQFFGGSVADGLSAIVTAVDRVSGIFEKELAIRFVLVADNDKIVFTNPNTDPYSNFNGLAMLGQNQARLDAAIGAAKYELGHVFSTGGGGIAGLRVVGKGGLKAFGVTGSPSPINDAFHVDYVAHEIGHQFGANHTFNGVNGATAGNRNGPTAYEPGSGTTIMGYAGISGADDIQSNSDAYFHAASLNEISNYTASGPGIGVTRTETGNNIPTADAGRDWVIPAKTPFALTGAGTDADGDTLTYAWEQYDLGPAAFYRSADNGKSPLFRSLSPTTSPTRTFPTLNTLTGSPALRGETLPSKAQMMKFRLTVRDNRTTGAFNRDDVNVRVIDTGDPFAVSFPNTNVNLPGGSTQTITWEVAGTDKGPINAKFVNIRLSLDGGQSYPVIAASVPNDGSHDVVLPNVTTTGGRIRIEPVGNVFFDLGNSNFRITAGPTVVSVSSPAPDGRYELGAVVPITVAYSGPVKVTGVPQLLLSNGGVAAYVGGTGTTTLTFNYTVSAGDAAADLDYASTTALVLNGGTVTTPGNFPVARTLPELGAAGSLAVAKDLVIDTTDTAYVAGVSSPLPAGTYGTGAVIPITVTFDRPVVVTGAPRLALNSHAASVATYVGGSGTNTLTFNYTVGLADSTSDLDYASTTALAFNGGTIVSPITGADANPMLPAPGAAGSLAAANDLFIGNPSVSLTDATYETVEGIGTFTVTVLRIGDPTGAVSVDYTVTAGTADASDYTVTSPPSPLTWADGDATPRQITFEIADDTLSEGRESLAITLSNLVGAGAFGIGSAVLTVRQSDGKIPGKFTDLDGDVATISLAPKTGAGSLLVYLTNDALPVSLLESTGTDLNRSVVTVGVVKARTSTDGGTFAVGGVTGSGLKALNMAKSPVAGNGIHLTGMLQTLKLDSLASGADVVTTGPATPKKVTLVSVRNAIGDGSDVVLNGPVSTFTAGSVGNGLISAPKIGTLSVRGNFGGDVAVSGEGVLAGKPALAVLKVIGAVDGSAIDVAGVVGTVTVGSFLNSHLFAGYAGDDVGVGTYNATAAINSFRSTSKTGGFKNSSLIAATVKTVVLASVDGLTAGDKFGVYADLAIKSVTVTNPKNVYLSPTSAGFEDFEVRVV